MGEAVYLCKIQTYMICTPTPQAYPPATKHSWLGNPGNMTEIHGELSSKPCLMTPEGQRVLPISLTCYVPHVLFHRLSGSHMSLWCLEAFWYHIIITSHIVSHVSYHAIFFADVHISLTQKRSLKVYTAARDQMLNPSDTAGHDNLECV
jgi:hypothetical protein